MNAQDQNKYILAVDHGSTGLKTSLFSVDGRLDWPHGLIPQHDGAIGVAPGGCQ